MFTKENQTLYLSCWQYNAALILEELAKIIIDNGGHVKPAYHRGYIENRSFYECAQDAQRKAERLTENVKSGIVEMNEKRSESLAKWTAEAEENKKAGEASRTPAEHITYIIFTLNGFYYSIELNENPFFEFYYRKTPITANNERSRDAVGEELNKDFLHDCFIMISEQKPGIAEDRKEAANMIFNQVTSAKPCKKAIESTRRRVANTYNSGYHYETIQGRERLEKIDF